MSYSFNLHRPGAIAEQGPNGSLKLAAAAVVEFLAPGRVPSLSVRGDLPLKPGVVYKAFTGVSTNFPIPFLGCQVRASPDAWRFGVEVKRLDYGEQSELLIYFTVLEQIRLDQLQLTFEVHNWTLEPLDPSAPFGNKEGATLSLPGIKIALEPSTARRVTERPVAKAAPAAPTISEAEAEKRARDWINTPDEKGRVVNASDVVAPHPVAKAANVQAAAVPKDMKSNLSRGVVTAPLRAVPSEVAGEGQPKPLDPTLKEEFTVITPQAERAADPVVEPAAPSADPTAALNSV